jgi:DNA uptake protein ComE-like DNA-binding protein
MVGLLVAVIMLPIRLTMALIGLVTAMVNAGGRRRHRSARRRQSRTISWAGAPAYGVGAQAATPAAGKASTHRWWAWMPAYTVGILAFVPFVHAAVKLRRRSLAYTAAAYTVGDIAVWLLLNASGNTGSNSGHSGGATSTVGSLIAVALAVAGTVQTLRLRYEVFGMLPSAPPAPPLPPNLHPAVAEALASRARRNETRQMIASDPALARDLKVGRPDLVRTYDDGGLVDVNHVPAETLVRHLGMPATEADLTVGAREKIGRFSSVDELGVLAGLSPDTVDDIRDRATFL